MMVERYTTLTCQIDESGPKNRAAGLDAIASLILKPGERQLANLLFRLAWPESNGETKPESWTIWKKVEELGELLGGLKRTATKELLDSLAKRELLTVTTKPAKPSGYQINWQRIYEISTPKQNLPEASGNKAEASAQNRRPPPEEPEASGENPEAFTRRPPDLSEQSDSDDSEPSETVLAIYRGFNHLANATRNEAKQILDALGRIEQLLIRNLANPEASGNKAEASAETPEASASGGLRKQTECLSVCLEDTKSNKQTNNTNNTGAEASGSGGLRQDRQPMVWPFKSILRSHLTSPIVLKLHQAAVEQGYCPAGEQARLDFLANANHCATDPKVHNPGACFAKNVERGIGFATERDYRAARGLLTQIFDTQVPKPAEASKPVRTPLPKPHPKPVPIVTEQPVRPAGDLLATIQRERQRLAGISPTPDPMALGKVMQLAGISNE